MTDKSFCNFLDLVGQRALIRFARVSSHVADFNTRNKLLTAKLLKEGIGIKNSVKGFLECYGDLVYNFRKTLAEMIFLINFRKKSFVIKEPDTT